MYVCLIESCSTSPKILSASPTPIQVFNEEFRYICADGFTQDTAQVVCRENAQANALPFFGINSTLLTTQYPIAEFTYECNGTEASLCDCPSDSQTCNSDMIVVIQCDLPGMYYIFACAYTHTYIFLSQKNEFEFVQYWLWILCKYKSYVNTNTMWYDHEFPVYTVIELYNLMYSPVIVLINSE